MANRCTSSATSASTRSSRGREAGTAVSFVRIAEAVEARMPEVLGKPLKMNVSGAIPAVLLGAGFRSRR